MDRAREPLRGMLAARRVKKWSCGTGTPPMHRVTSYCSSCPTFRRCRGWHLYSGDAHLSHGHGEHQRLTVATKPSAKFRKLGCLTTTTWFTSRRTGTARTDISAVTWCLTAQGLPASEYRRGNPQVVPPWLNLTLVSARRGAPKSDFQRCHLSWCATVYRTGVGPGPSPLRAPSVRWSSVEVVDRPGDSIAVSPVEATLGATLPGHQRS